MYKFIEELDEEFKKRQSEKQEKLLREGTIPERAVRLLEVNVLPVLQEIAHELESLGHCCEVTSRLQGDTPNAAFELCPRFNTKKFECGYVRFSLADSGERMNVVWSNITRADETPRNSQKFIYFRELDKQRVIDAVEILIRSAFRQ